MKRRPSRSMIWIFPSAFSVRRRLPFTACVVVVGCVLLDACLLNTLTAFIMLIKLPPVICVVSVYLKSACAGTLPNISIAHTPVATVALMFGLQLNADPQYSLPFSVDGRACDATSSNSSAETARVQIDRNVRR